MRRHTLDGPPWGGYIDPDEAYVRGQMGQMGSGLMGGWSQSGFGAAVDAGRGIAAEIRETVAALGRRDARPLAEPPDAADPRLPHAA